MSDESPLARAFSGDNGRLSTNRIFLLSAVALTFLFLILLCFFPHIMAAGTLIFGKLCTAVGLKGAEDRNKSMERRAEIDPAGPTPPLPPLPPVPAPGPTVIVNPAPPDAEPTPREVPDPEVLPEPAPDHEGPRKPVFHAAEFTGSPAFCQGLAFVLNHETEWRKAGNGLYTVRTEHDSNDPGGTTRYGVDQRSHPHEDIEGLTLDRAAEIYAEEWEACGADKLEPALAIAHFDAAVNAGPGRARIWLAKTKDAAEYCDLREHFYREEVRPALRQHYLKGWLARLSDLRAELDLPA